MRRFEDWLRGWLDKRWRRRTTKERQWEANVDFAITTEQLALTEATKHLLTRAESLRQAQLHNGHDRAKLVDTHPMPPNPDHHPEAP